jgi:hypothetical protein
VYFCRVVPLRNGGAKIIKKLEYQRKRQKKNMEKAIKKVKIKLGMNAQLAATFNVTKRAVTNAINGTSNSKLAQSIRVAAVEMGGDPIY